MSVFDKWAWIKRNWIYIIEEASNLDLVFVGGTALNLALFNEYRASEDIDLYDPHASSIGTDHEEKIIEQLKNKLVKKGFEINSAKKHMLYIGPNIKIDVFNNATSYNQIEKKVIHQTPVLLFDIQTYLDMKINSLLCRSLYDARDLVDLFVIKKETSVSFSFPTVDCPIIEESFEERLREIDETKKDDLLIFQNRDQIVNLPVDEFFVFKRWLYDWLSTFR
ncbi:MAG: nucleotidyl transferase AbiEii/AbiGii toxin family protein [Candidatus Thermoplasmatota archaeon]|nr:nucleotidyl transferase AbiEii/AbiGii toxin family protein [Candidatus Thermoplasmatota archaeon]